MNNKKISNIFILLIVHCSLIIVNCSNPLIIQMLDPKTASFETNGGSFVESQIVYRDYPVKRPSTPSREGFTFDAWYVDNESFLEQWDFSAVPTANITLYANWIFDGGTDIDDDPHDPDDDPSDPDDDPSDPDDDPSDPDDDPSDPDDDPSDPDDDPSDPDDDPSDPDDDPNDPDDDPSDPDDDPNDPDDDPGDPDDEPGDPDDDPDDPDVDPSDPDDDPSDPDDDPSDPDDDPDDPDVEYTVTLVYNDSVTADKTNNVPYSGRIDEPDKPTRGYPPEEGLYLNSIPTEYAFGGWFTEEDTLWDFSNDTVSGNMTLHAKWTLPNKIPDIGEYNNIISDTISYINNPANANAGTYILLLKETTTGGYAGSQTINAAGFNLTIKGIGPRTITYNGTAGSFFTINNPTATLTLSENFTLHGNSVNASLITVTNGTLVMESGSAIIGHTNTSADGGGGVKVNGGTFIMNGGTISGNKATGNYGGTGGGVYVGSGTFTMTGGTISENEAISNNNDGGCGGGVVVSSGTFTMTGGTISGNTAAFAGGVYVQGTFNMNGGLISGNTVTGSGGGVYLGSEGTFQISNGTVYGNENTTLQNLRNNIPTEEYGAALFVADGGTAKDGNGSDIPLTSGSVPALGGPNYFRYTNSTITGQ